MTATAAEQQPELVLPGQNLQGAQGTRAVPSSLHDIEGPIGFPDPPPYPLYMAIIIVLITLLALGRWLYRRRKLKQSVIAPDVRAREALQQLSSHRREEEAHYYLTHVSNILRSYLEERFRLATSSLTTREFLATLTPDNQAGRVLADHTKEFTLCFERCDYAKFARRPADSDQLKEIELTVLALIDNIESRQQPDKAK